MEILESAWPNPTQSKLPNSFPVLSLRATNGLIEIPVGSSQRMYVCGITPYDATHLGHAATYLTFDLINRFIRTSGGSISFVENVTDIDEPLLERATRDSIGWQSLAQNETDLFASDMSALRIFAPNWFVPVTQVMDLVDLAIAAMDSNGYVYRLDDDLYFRV